MGGGGCCVLSHTGGTFTPAEKNPVSFFKLLLLLFCWGGGGDTITHGERRGRGVLSHLQESGCLSSMGTVVPIFEGQFPIVPTTSVLAGDVQVWRRMLSARSALLVHTCGHVLLELSLFHFFSNACESARASYILLSWQGDVARRKMRHRM